MKKILLLIIICFGLMGCGKNNVGEPKSIESRYEKIQEIDLGTTPQIGRTVFDKHFPEIQIVLKDFDYGEKELTLTFGKMGNTTFEEKIYSNAPFIWKLHERNDKSNISEHIFVNWIIEEVNGRPHVILQIEHRMSEIVSCTY